MYFVIFSTTVSGILVLVLILFLIEQKKLKRMYRELEEMRYRDRQIHQETMRIIEAT
ncbi:unnamed protein product, partial [marine sediment metagenome]